MADPLTLAIASAIASKSAEAMTEQARQAISVIVQKIRAKAVARYVQAIGGQIQVSAVFGDDMYILRGTVTEAA